MSKTPRKVPWSPDRPKRWDHDPMLAELRTLSAANPGSYWAKANVSGLAPSTIKNIESGVTRRPQGVTLQMLYKSLGYKLVAVKEDKLT